MKPLYLILFFTFSFGILAQTNPNSVPTYFGCKTNKITDLTKKEIISNSLLHISSKVDSIFLKRMKLKENDSIEFKIKYTVDKFGLLNPDSTKINTGIIAFDNYMKMVVNTIPRFTPAKNENEENVPYSIEFDGRFTISQNKMIPFEFVVKEYFFDTLETLPVFPGCENAKNLLDCFREKMADHIRNNQQYPEEALDHGIQGRIQTLFVIDEKGNITEIEILKTKGKEILEKEAYRVISLLPSMAFPGYLNGKPVRVKYSQPINFKLQ
ncbi:energy transducer TonB [Flavobacterium lacisediminis]|uniref:Energy transducer TonB n=1 Tax=Flavobacterium lacisediminis TaxID=2989705 RepID=A0ABT3EF68_9FLAO|nr:energy transducer TonB [Flavobacterium lacisediminis]MCW1147220.1 energy transducer TonB [Flavobacterium lacisediminis]